MAIDYNTKIKKLLAGERVELSLEGNGTAYTRFEYWTLEDIKEIGWSGTCFGVLTREPNPDENSEEPYVGMFYYFNEDDEIGSQFGPFAFDEKWEQLDLFASAECGEPVYEYGELIYE